MSGIGCQMVFLRNAKNVKFWFLTSPGNKKPGRLSYHQRHIHQSFTSRRISGKMKQLVNLWPKIANRLHQWRSEDFFHFFCSEMTPLVISEEKNFWQIPRRGVKKSSKILKIKIFRTNFLTISKISISTEERAGK